MGFQFKEALRSLCCNNGWSYAVLWRIKCPDSMLLMSEDAYYEEQFRMMIDKMLHQVHVVGEGIIGRIAYTGKHRWIFSDSFCEELSSIGPFDSQTAFQNTAEWRHQFLAGIKTIAIISVSSQAVIQFGSTQKIVARPEFVDHVRSLFRQLESTSEHFLPGNAQKAFNSEIYDPHGTFASVISSSNTCSDYSNIKRFHDGSYKEGPSSSGLNHGNLQPPVFAVPLLSSSTHATKESRGLLNKVAAFTRNSSSHFSNRCETSGPEAQVILSSSNMLLPQVRHSNSSSANNLLASNPIVSTCSGNISAFTPNEEQLLSEMGIQGFPNMFPTRSHTITPCENTFPNFQGDSILNPSYITSRSLYSVNDTISNRQNGAGKMTDNQNSPLFHVSEGGPSTCKSYSTGVPFVPQLPKESASLPTLPGEFRSLNTPLTNPNPNPENNPTQWIAPQLEQVNNGITIPPNDDLLQALGFAPMSSSLVGGDVTSSALVNENSFSATDQLPAGDDLFEILGLDLRQSQGQESWDDIILPVGSGNCSNLNTGVSECISELDLGSMIGPEKGFPEFELEQLLDAVLGNASSVTNLNSDDPSPTTTITRQGSTSEYGNQVQFAGLSSLSGSMDALLPPSNSENTRQELQKDMVSKSLVNSLIHGSYNCNAESAVTIQPKRKSSQEPAKVTRKRARPGESTRPRPKDRQQIQDRVKELRDIVPNGAKCSIDSLLDRTVKHMVFLQSVTNYADKLKQVDEPKMIGEEDGVVLKDNSNGNSGGATYAFEVGGQTMICPIIVEDLNPPGQMLVEMLCEEGGFFLEIADIIRGFGLTILKGVMEIRDEKIWARFVVEVNRNVTRMDIFLSLVQLLQQTATSSISSGPSTSAVPSFVNYQQSPMSLPFSLANRFQ
ncbi:transcription factor LHW-like [Tasmannia lanceolata]|uniref:transcription factor LHW-like n=1 Tax=Tasmannia lanceolata TaxID=3420 RepID=UPI0040638F99